MTSGHIGSMKQRRCLHKNRVWISLVHQYGCRFLAWEHQQGCPDVIWKFSYDIFELKYGYLVLLSKFWASTIANAIYPQPTLSKLSLFFRISINLYWWFYVKFKVTVNNIELLFLLLGALNTVLCFMTCLTVWMANCVWGW